MPNLVVAGQKPCPLSPHGQHHWSVLTTFTPPQKPAPLPNEPDLIAVLLCGYCLGSQNLGLKMGAPPTK